jgi:hypothetical protein
MRLLEFSQTGAPQDSGISLDPMQVSEIQRVHDHGASGWHGCTVVMQSGTKYLLVDNYESVLKRVNDARAESP